MSDFRTIQCQVGDEIYAWLKVVAQSEGVGVSEIVRRALDAARADDEAAAGGSLPDETPTLQSLGATIDEALAAADALEDGPGIEGSPDLWSTDEAPEPQDIDAIVREALAGAEVVPLEATKRVRTHRPGDTEREHEQDDDDFPEPRVTQLRENKLRRGNHGRKEWGQIYQRGGGRAPAQPDLPWTARGRH